MSKLFFDHLIKLDRIRKELSDLDLAEREVEELSLQIDELMQQKVVEVIFDILHKDHHDIFIGHLHTDPGNEEILRWLKQQCNDVEEKIQAAVAELETELVEELQEVGG